MRLAGVNAANAPFQRIRAGDGWFASSGLDALHFGEAVLGLLGSAAQFNYTAVGRTVVIAARLQALAGAGEIVMSEAVYQAAHKAGILPELPSETAQLKGMTAPFVIYRLRVFESPREAAAFVESTSGG